MTSSLVWVLNEHSKIVRSKVDTTDFTLCYIEAIEVIIRDIMNPCIYTVLRLLNLESNGLERSIRVYWRWSRKFIKFTCKSHCICPKCSLSFLLLTFLDALVQWVQSVQLFTKCSSIESFSLHFLDFLPAFH